MRVEEDHDYNNAISPLALMTTPWILILVLYSVSGLKFEWGISLKTVAVVAACCLFFSVGSKISVGSKKFSKKDTGYSEIFFRLSTDRVILIFSIVGLFGAAIQIAVGNLNLSPTDWIASSRLRDLRNYNDLGIRIQDIGNPMGAMGYVAFLAMKILKKRNIQVSRKITYLSSVSCLSYILATLSLGSRTVVVALLISVILIDVCSGRKNSNEGLKVRFLLILGFKLLAISMSIILLSLFVLRGRIENYGFSLFEYMSYTSLDRGVYLPKWLIAISSWDNAQTLGWFVFIVYSLIYYLVHGIFEFSYIFEWGLENDPPLAFGEKTFGNLGLLVSSLFKQDSDFENVFPHQGRYSGTFGSAFIDYGTLGLIMYFLIFGYLAGTIFKIARKYDSSLGSNLVYFILAPMILSIPVFDALGGANGTYIVFSALLFWLITFNDSLMQSVVKRPSSPKEADALPGHS